MGKRKFTKEFLRDMVDEPVEDTIVGTGRWSINHALVFQFEGKFYRTTYSVGATEMQDEAPFQYAPDEIECVEVAPAQKVVTIYEPVDA